MKAMVNKAVYSDVEAKYGRPFKAWDLGNAYLAYWRKDPSPNVTEGCGLRDDHCLTCNRFWIVYRLRFAKGSKLLLEAKWDLFSSYTNEPVSEMPLTGITAAQCMKNKVCKERMEEACRATVEMNPPRDG